MLKACISSFCLLVSAYAYALEPVQLIEVFVNQPLANQAKAYKNHKGEPIEVAIYDLSGPEKFENALSEGIDESATHEQVTNIVMKRVNGLSKTYMEEHVFLAYQGLLKATQYELTKIPAIVFNNGQSVIYGVSDVQDAILIYRKASD